MMIQAIIYEKMPAKKRLNTVTMTHMSLIKVGSAPKYSPRPPRDTFLFLQLNLKPSPNIYKPTHSIFGP